MHSLRKSEMKKELKVKKRMVWAKLGRIFRNRKKYRRDRRWMDEIQAAEDDNLQRGRD